MRTGFAGVGHSSEMLARGPRRDDMKALRGHSHGTGIEVPRLCLIDHDQHQQGQSETDQLFDEVATRRVPGQQHAHAGRQLPGVLGNAIPQWLEPLVGTLTHASKCFQQPLGAADARPARHSMDLPTEEHQVHDIAAGSRADERRRHRNRLLELQTRAARR